MAEKTTTHEVVTYRIYSKKFASEDNENKDYLLKIAAKCLSECEKFTRDYIWQRGGFFLAPSFDAEENVPLLIGDTDVGENIEDEWIIISLLFHLSKSFPDFMISVEDSDGQVLLIEAAEQLPRWLRPETSKNRVFINQGQVHIIPIPRSPAEVTLWPTGTPSIQTALNLICGPVKTVANNSILSTINSRINGYPAKIDSLLHHAHCFLPVNLVYAIQCRPSLVAAAVQAFYERDPLETKALRNIRNFEPQDRVLTRVKFTKLLYSQLLQQNFLPFPKSEWRLPPTSDLYYKAHELGFKLVSGFELLCNRCLKSQDNKILTAGPKWKKYLGYLKKSGYFKGELEDSRLYNEKLRNAQEYFQCFSQLTPDKMPDYYNVATSGLVDLLQEGREHSEEIRRDSQHVAPEDDDGWLHLTPEELDRMMLNVWGQEKVGTKPKRYQEKLNTMVNGVKDFVDKVSSYEGAETERAEEDDDIHFDGETFLGALQKMLGTSGGGEQEMNPDQLILDTDPDSDSDSSSVYEENEEGVKSTCKETAENIDPMMKSIYESMAKELHGSNVQRGFDTINSTAGNSRSAAEDNVDNQALDIDFNLVKNFLESFSSQEGLSGPVSSILNSLGMNLPPEEVDFMNAES